MLKKSKDAELAKQLLNAVWRRNLKEAELAILEGAKPSWIVNGYPLIIHAVYNRDVQMTMLLIQYGALQKEEALGFALEYGIGELVLPLTILGIQPVAKKESQLFGEFPSRYAPLARTMPTHILQTV